MRNLAGGFRLLLCDDGGAPGRVLGFENVFVMSPDARADRERRTKRTRNPYAIGLYGRAADSRNAFSFLDRDG